MNATSSRSHACLILSLQKRSNTITIDEEGGTFEKMTRSHLFLVDLAGSERLKKTGASGVRKEEAKYINLSLTTLGIVVHSLEANSAHVPFRDSKLTRLLQDSLAGNGKTRIIVTIGPDAANMQETISTLNFGQRAMKVKTVARVNESIDYKLLSTQLQVQIDDYDNRCRQLEEKLMESKTECNKLQTKVKETVNQLVEMKQLERENHINTIGDQDQLKKEYDTQVQVIKEESKRENEKLRQTFNTEIQKRETLIDEIDSELADKEEELDELEKRVETQTIQLDQQRIRLETLQEQLNEKKREIEIVIERLHENESILQTKEEKYKLDISQLEVELLSVQQSKEDQQQIHVLKTEGLMKELQECKKLLAASNARVDELSETLTHKDEEIATNMDRIWQLEHAVSEQKLIIEELESGYQSPEPPPSPLPPLSPDDHATDSPPPPPPPDSPESPSEEKQLSIIVPTPLRSNEKPPKLPMHSRTVSIDQDNSFVPVTKSEPQPSTLPHVRRMRTNSLIPSSIPPDLESQIITTGVRDTLTTEQMLQKWDNNEPLDTLQLSQMIKSLRTKNDQQHAHVTELENQIKNNDIHKRIQKIVEQYETKAPFMSSSDRYQLVEQDCDQFVQIVKQQVDQQRTRKKHVHFDDSTVERVNQLLENVLNIPHMEVNSAIQKFTQTIIEKNNHLRENADTEDILSQILDMIGQEDTSEEASTGVLEYTDKALASMDVSILSLSLYDRNEENTSQTSELLNKLEHYLINREQHIVTRAHWLAIASKLLGDLVQKQESLEKKSRTHEQQISHHVQTLRTVLESAHQNRDESVVLRKSLFDCAEELAETSKNSKYAQLQYEIEVEEIKRRDRAARVIQKYFRSIQRRVQLRESASLATKLAKENKKHKRKLEQYQQLIDQTSAGTGVMLMRRTMDEIEHVFAIFSTFFLYDENDLDLKRKTMDSPKLWISTDADIGSDRTNTPPSPSNSSFSNLKTYKRHSTSSPEITRGLSFNLLNSPNRFSLRMSPNKQN
jgi:hypothetical protein